MSNRLIQNGGPKPPGPEQGRKAAALYHLYEALLNEEYECCAELIRQAKGHGAGVLEIRAILSGHIRLANKGAEKGGPNTRF